MAARANRRAVTAVEALGPGGPMPTPDPFLFAVHHRDAYPEGDALMQAPVMGNGADFDFRKPFRMYHGDRIPGFPQHPHRGFETLTAVVEGVVDHTDSKGNAGRYGNGDLQWMTAGGGVVHGEMFPLLHEDQPNPAHLFQIWLNLPAKNKMCDPFFTMHWAEQIPKVSADGGRATVTVWAGEVGGKQALRPPPKSWACEEDADVAVWMLQLAPGGAFELPPAKAGKLANRSLYFVEGDRLDVAGEQDLDRRAKVDLVASEAVLVRNSGSEAATCLMLQGRPIGEPVVQHGPFVMNTQAEIRQAFMDYQRTQFGGWPWPEDAMVFPRDKGRFALCDGVETRP